MRVLALLCVLGLWLGSCSLATRQRGQSCQRTAQCALGLACVAGRCSRDLRPIAEQSSVPDLSAGASAAMGDGGLDASPDGGRM